MFRSILTVTAYTKAVNKFVAHVIENNGKVWSPDKPDLHPFQNGKGMSHGSAVREYGWFACGISKAK